MEPKQQPPYPLRMPSDMRSHYEDLASASGRSLNAEIVAGLMELQALRNQVGSLEAEIRELAQGRERDSTRFSQSIEALTQLTGMLGFYVKELASLVPKKSPEGREMIRLIGAMGAQVHGKDYHSAVQAAADLVSFAERHGLLDGKDKSTHDADEVAQKLVAKPGLLD